MDTLTLLLSLLAVARLTRLVTDDKVLERPRLALLRRLVDRRGEDSMLAYLVLCPWCVSPYVGAGVMSAWWAWGDTRMFTAAVAVLAASHVAGFLAGKE
jgi:hypothetical protein